MRQLLLIIFFITSFSVNAQKLEDNNTDSSEGLPIKAILKKLNADKIEVDPNNEEGVFKARHQKTQKWGMFQNLDDEKIKLKKLIPMAYDSLKFFSEVDDFTPVFNNGKVGFYLSPWQHRNAKQTVACRYDEYHPYEYEGKKAVAVKKDGKWGLVNWRTGKEETEFVYDDRNELPKFSSSFEDFPLNAVTKKLNADKIEFDLHNEDGVFKARNMQTKKWGLFQIADFKKIQIKEAIPMQYDSLRFFPFNGSFTAVYNNGKVGFYLSAWSYETKAKQTVPCRYDEYHKYLYESKEQIFLAVKRDGKWGWVDWLTGEEKSKFIYDDKKNLPAPDWDQQSYLD